VLDIDRIHDDAAHRPSVVDTLAAQCGVIADFSDLAKFFRYYEFEGLDVATVCGDVELALKNTLRDGRIEPAVRMLATQAPTVPVTAALELLLGKIRDSLNTMQTNDDRVYVSIEDWNAIAEKHRMIWFNLRIRGVAQRVYPLAAPIMRAARRAGIWH